MTQALIAELSLALLLPAAIGFVFASLFWPRDIPFRRMVLIKCCLGVGVGFGLFSCFFFIWLLLFGPSSKGLVATQVLLAVCACAILIYRVRIAKAASALDLLRKSSDTKKPWILMGGFYLMLTITIANLAILALKKPHGEWDAWAIWNMRARFIFKAGPLWRDAFSYLIDRSRPDYPILIPASIAGIWTEIGTDTVVVPAVLAILFTLALVGLTVSSLSLLRGRSQALFAGLVLLGTPFLITHTASQYADVPLGFFFLATLVLISLQDSLASNAGDFMLLAGITAGLSAWTKNEGLLFIVSIVVARFVFIVPVKGARFYFKQMLSFATGLTPILLIILYFKVNFAPPNYLIALQGSSDIVVKLLDSSRYVLVWGAFAKQIPEFGGWAVSIPLLLVFYLLIVGTAFNGRSKSSVGTSLITLCLMLLGYSMIYIISPIDLKLQLDTSLSRILLQLWPSFVFVYFLLVRPIGQIISEGKLRDEGPQTPLQNLQQVRDASL
jgi:hypothetical protein